MKNFIFINYLLLLIFIGLISLNAQPLSTRSKKAIQLYDQATRNIDLYDFKGAITLLEEAVKIDSNFTEAWLLMADAYDFLSDYEKVIEVTEKALRSGGEKYPVIYYFCAQAYMRTGKYEKALQMSETFLSKKKYTPLQKKEIEKLKANCYFSLEALKKPKNFQINNLGDSINSVFDEYWPSLSADEEILVFTRLLPNEKKVKPFYSRGQEDIFYAQKIQSKQWSKAVEIDKNINTQHNEGSQSITADGQKIFYTACNKSDSKGRCDIYYSNKTFKGWSKPINIGAPINTVYNEKQPALSADGRTLYFVSNRPGSKGKYDIWMSKLNDNGLWSEPVNLGDSINTEADEQSPFIHPDNKTLYFSSNGWIGMGGYDVYVSINKGCDTCWSQVRNLGYPLNTHNDETGLIVNAKGNTAFFASNRFSSKGVDIFSFELYPEVRPISVSYVKGKVFNAETLKPLRAEFELIDINSNLCVSKSISNEETGEFLICLPTNKSYALNVSKEGFLFYSDHFTITDTFSTLIPYELSIPLQPIKSGSSIVLKNIFFEINSYYLKNESKAELNQLVQFLQKYSKVKIEISGHTDNTGNEKFNLTLSENRAKSVKQYLIEAGIESSRISYKGYGEKKPIVSNDTEEGRAMNRRTEFKIIEN